MQNVNDNCTQQENEVENEVEYESLNSTLISFHNQLTKCV